MLSNKLYIWCPSRGQHVPVVSHTGAMSLNTLCKVNWIGAQKAPQVEGMKNRLGWNEGAIFSSNKYSRECKKSEFDGQGAEIWLSATPLILPTIWNQSFVSMWPCNIKENMSTDLRLVRCFVTPRQKVSNNCGMLIVKNTSSLNYSSTAKRFSIPASV